jgi:hypothetical protein
MKKLVFSLTGMTVFLLSFSLSSLAQDEAKVTGPLIEFDKETHDYGTIYVNGDGNCVFTFTNKGTEPLLLTNVRAGCGCTVPQWPREPVLPGDSAEIKVKYTTVNRPHTINKSIVVTSNSVTKNTVVLRIKGEVVPAPDQALPEKTQSSLSAPGTK